MQQFEQSSQLYVQQMQETRQNGRLGADGVTVIIPVVVHVIYSNSTQNISDAQIQSQIDVLNADFAALNSDYNNTPAEFQGLRSGDTKIQFEMATLDPNGNPTNGITRKSSSTTNWGTNDAMKSSASGGVDPWPTGDYLNMWICNIGGGILGYAQFPGGSASTDGVVIGPNYFGSTNGGSGFYLSAPFDKGRTTTHEVGHWLNLRHIWGDGACSATDYVDDTPSASGPNYGCPSNPKASCSSNDMHMNYMDYVDDVCMFMFSQGQEDRMRATFFGTNAPRASFVAGTPPPPPTCNDTEVTLTLVLDNYPSETSWTLTDGGGATVASGSGYSVANSTVTETFCLPDGDYTFTINDSYGDGICCAYGSGSYDVSAGSTNYAAGGTFAASEATPFTVGTGGGGGGTDPAPTGYCASKGNNVSDEYINRVQMGSIDNTSGSNGGYGDFTGQKTTITVGSSNTITITPTWTGTVYSEAYNVWIDYNRDGDFLDAGESVYTRAKTKVTPIVGSFTVPSGVSAGYTRMRVQMKYNANATSCETFTYGEVEDYEVLLSTGARTQLGFTNNSLTVFPNPANELVNVRLETTMSENTQIILTDIGGRIIKSENRELPAGNHLISLPLDNVSPGLYFVNIKGESYTLSQKLVID